MKRRFAYTMLEMIITLAIVIMIFSIVTANWVKITNDSSESAYLDTAAFGILKIFEKARYESVRRQVPINFSISISALSGNYILSAQNLNSTPGSTLSSYEFPEGIYIDKNETGNNKVKELFYYNGYLTKTDSGKYIVINSESLTIFSGKSDLRRNINFNYGIPKVE